MALATGLDDLFFSPVHYLSLSLSFSIFCFYIFPWETAPAKPSVEQWIKVTKKHDVMYTYTQV